MSGAGARMGARRKDPVLRPFPSPSLCLWRQLSAIPGISVLHSRRRTCRIFLRIMTVTYTPSPSLPYRAGDFPPMNFHGNNVWINSRRAVQTPDPLSCLCLRATPGHLGALPGGSGAFSLRTPFLLPTTSSSSRRLRSSAACPVWMAAEAAGRGWARREPADPSVRLVFHSLTAGHREALTRK